jgi:hypothetical protein
MTETQSDDPSVYEQLSRAVAPHLDGRSAADLSGDDVAVLARDAGVDVQRLAFWGIAQTLGTGSRLPPELFFGLACEGMPLTEQSLRRAGDDELGAALQAAVAHHTIPDHVIEPIEEAVNALRQGMQLVAVPAGSGDWPSLTDDLLTFVAANPDLDLKTTSIPWYVRLHPESLAGVTDPQALVQKVVALQGGASTEPNNGAAPLTHSTEPVARVGLPIFDSPRRAPTQTLSLDASGWRRWVRAHRDAIILCSLIALALVVGVSLHQRAVTPTPRYLLPPRQYHIAVRGYVPNDHVGHAAAAYLSVHNTGARVGHLVLDTQRCEYHWTLQSLQGDLGLRPYTPRKSDVGDYYDFGVLPHGATNTIIFTATPHDAGTHLCGLDFYNGWDPLTHVPSDALYRGGMWVTIRP